MHRVSVFWAVGVIEIVFKGSIFENEAKTMQIKCGKCGRMMHLPPSAAGKKIRCGCGETLTVPAESGESINTGQRPAGGGARPVESYWWLMAYISINRILGYVMIAVLALAAVVGGFRFLGQIYLLSDLPLSECLPALLGVVLIGIAYVLGSFIYVVIWFASADFLRAVVEIAENTRRIK